MRTPTLISLLYLSLLVNSLPHSIPSPPDTPESHLTRRSDPPATYHPMHNMGSSGGPSQHSNQNPEDDPETSRTGMLTAAQKQKGKAKNQDEIQEPEPVLKEGKEKKKGKKGPATNLNTFDEADEAEKGQKGGKGKKKDGSSGGGTDSSTSMGPSTLDDVGYFSPDSSDSSEKDKGCCVIA